MNNQHYKHLQDLKHHHRALIGLKPMNQTVTATGGYYVVAERGCRMSMPIPLDPALVSELMVEFGCVHVRPARVGINVSYPATTV